MARPHEIAWPNQIAVGHAPQFGPMTVLLNPAMKKNDLGMSAKERVYAMPRLIIVEFMIP